MNREQFSLDLKHFSSHTFFDGNEADRSVNQNWSLFKDKVTDLMKKHIPTRTFRPKFDVPWMSTSIKRGIRKKHRLYKRAKKTGHKQHWKSFKRQQAELKKIIRNTRLSYLDDKVGKGLEAGNTKPFWNYMKSLRKDAPGIYALKDQGVQHKDPEAKANILNSFFGSVFTKDHTSKHQHSVSYNFPNMDEIMISTAGVHKQLANLKVGKAPGPDGIPPIILKYFADDIAPILTFIYQQSLDTSTVPDDWRKANVIPIHKKEAKNKASNYRPVSLTCICCKILEHIIVSNIHKHFDNFDILTDVQHGFRPRRSCESQLLIAYYDLIQARQTGTQVDMMALDFSKAFDKVSHPRLLSKLDALGVRGKTHNWIESFLSLRTQTVVLEGSSSNTIPVESGVPQGSVLGPILFLIYINDLAIGLSPGTKCRLFADDCLLYREIRSFNDVSILQSDLDTLQNWERAWLMEFNPSKCWVMNVNPSRKVDHTYHYNIHGIDLVEVNTLKYLGVHLSDDLKFHKHINELCAKANQQLGMLRRNLFFLFPDHKGAGILCFGSPICRVCLLLVGSLPAGSN